MRSGTRFISEEEAARIRRMAMSGEKPTPDVEKLARAMCDVHHHGDMPHVWTVYVPLAQKAIEMLAAGEKPTPVTDSEKLADQMAHDIFTGKVAAKDRPVVRKALDDADTRSKSKDAAQDVWRRATGRYMPAAGGAMKPFGEPNNWRTGPDGEPQEVV